MEYKELFTSIKNKFLNAAKNCRYEQLMVFSEIIKNNSNTKFAKEHNWNKIKTVKDFQNYVPVSVYENYENYIEEIKQGNNNILTEDKILLLEPTSGSTSINKLIPYNKSLKKAFNRGIEPWLSDIFLNYPELLNIPMYWSITPDTKINNIESKIKIGFDNDLDYLNGLFARIIEKNIISPSIKSDFIKETANCLSNIKNIGLISVWNPSLLILLKENMPTDSNIRNTKFISCWDEGTSKIYSNQLKEIFPYSKIQGKGLLATEGIITVPIEGIGKLPCVQSHFYEFIDIESQEIKLIDELETGKKYSVLITTQGGLYRYKIGDILLCYGKYGNCPLLSFQGRENNISDYAGEKLNEEFINNILIKYQIADISKFHLFTPQNINNRINYVLYIEPTKIIDINKLENDIENELNKNFHYKYAMELKQLSPFKICVIKDGMKQYMDICVRKGQKLGDIKPKTFSNSFDYNFIGETDK